MSKTDAARARWRADLHEYGAAALKGAGLEEMAADSTAEVDYLRAYADLMEELSDAKEAFYAKKSEASRAVLDNIKRRVHDFRVASASTARPTPGVINNISEPSDSELEELGY